MYRLPIVACVALVFLAAIVRGEVIYTDIDDMVVNQSGRLSSFEVDLNGDATDDVRFQHQFFTPNDIKSPVFGLGSTRIGAHEALFPPDQLHAYLDGETLDSSPLSLRTSQYWDSSVGGMRNFGYAMVTSANGTNAQNPSGLLAEWNTPGHLFFRSASQGDRYVGVRLDVAGDIHFGWIRMRVDGGAGTGNDAGQMTVFDYAYESQPGLGIVMGDRGTPSLPSDLTGDRFVDFDDLTILLAHWDQSVSAGQGNLVDPLTTPINFQDLTFLLADWTGPGPVESPKAALGEAAVPEPSGLVLALLGLFGLCATTRRRRPRVNS